MAMPTVTSLAEAKAIAAAPLPLSRRNWLRLLLETIVCVGAAIAILECFFAFCRVGQGEFLQPDKELGCVHIPNKIVTWRLEGYSNDRLNSVGLRDTEHALAKPNGVYRIALLGDSATEGLQVSLADTYGKVLERQLNNSLGSRSFRSGNRLIRRFEVINFGCSSYSTGQELLQYRKQVLAYNVDAVILMYNRGDTMENTLEPEKGDSAEIRPYFYVDASGNVAVDSSVLAANTNKLSKSAFWDFLRAQSRIYGALSQMNLSLSLNESRYRKLRSCIDNLFKASQSNTQKGSPKIVPPTYPKQEPLNVTFALLAQFAAETKAHHQLLGVIVFPNWVRDPILYGQIAALKPFCQSLKVNFIDLTPAFFASADLRRNFFEYHFSPEGHTLTAKLLSTMFENQLLKPK